MSIGSRMKERRESLGLTQIQLADLLGVTKGAIGNYETGANSPKASLMFKIFEVLQCDANYIFQDEMKELDTDDLTVPEIKLAKKYRLLDPYGKEAVDGVLNAEYKRYEDIQATQQSTEEPEQPKVAKMPKARKSGNMVEIRVYDQPAAAGLGNYLDDPDYHIEQYPEHILAPGTDFGVRIDGDSMEPKIHDGYTVFVKAMPMVEPGEIGIFVISGKSYCKKLIVDHEKRQTRLKSLNPKYNDIVIGENDFFKTLGLVLGQWGPGSREDDFLDW